MSFRQPWQKLLQKLSELCNLTTTHVFLSDVFSLSSASLHWTCVYRGLVFEMTYNIVSTFKSYKTFIDTIRE